MTLDLVKYDQLSPDFTESSKQNELNILLNSPPRQDWVKMNNKVAYLPITAVEYLLTAIFVEWRVEIKEVKQLANSVVSLVRLHYKNPVTNEWSWTDGVGASPLQTKAGAAAADMGSINSAAVQMSAPAAESYAIKDAAEKLGKIFGKDLNRKDEIDYSELEDKFGGKITREKEEALEAIALAETPVALKAIYAKNAHLLSDPDIIAAFRAAKERLTPKEEESQKLTS